MPLRLGDADDLADLPELDEAILLEELKIRYTDGRIYVSRPHFNLSSILEIESH